MTLPRGGLSSYLVEIHFINCQLQCVFTKCASSCNFKTGTKRSWLREWGQEFSSLSLALCWWAAAPCQHTLYSFTAADFCRHNSLSVTLVYDYKIQRGNFIILQHRLAGLLKHVSIRIILSDCKFSFRLRLLSYSEENTNLCSYNVIRQFKTRTKTRNAFCNYIFLIPSSCYLSCTQCNLVIFDLRLKCHRDVQIFFQPKYRNKKCLGTKNH